METKEDILILRFKSGEDIITYLSSLSDNKLKLDNPLSMIYKTVDSGSLMLLTPWLPFDFITDNSIIVDESDILGMMKPSIRMVNSYTKALISLHDSSQKELAKDSLSFFSKSPSGTVH